MKVERKVRSTFFRFLVRLSNTTSLMVGTQYSNQMPLLLSTSCMSVAILFSQLTLTTATYQPVLIGFEGVWAFLNGVSGGLLDTASPSSPALVDVTFRVVLLFSILVNIKFVSDVEVCNS